MQCPDWTHLALALQTVLLGVVGGAASTDPWRLGIPANHVAVAVRDVAAALLWPAWLGLGSTHASDTIAVARDHAFAALQPQIAYEVLGTIASVFTAVAGGSQLRTLTWFIRRLPVDERDG